MMTVNILYFPSFLKQITLAGLAFCLLYITMVPSACAEVARLKVAFVLPLSGPPAFMGEQMRDGALLAHAELEEGIIDLQFEDDRLRSADSITILQKLLRPQERPDILILFGSHALEPARNILGRHNLPTFALTVSGNFALEQPIFQHMFSAPDQALALANRVNELDLKQVALVVSHYDAMRDFANEFTLSLNKLGGEVIIEEEVLPEQTDFRSLITRMQSRKPSAVVLALLPPQLGTFARQYRESGFAEPFFSFSVAQNIHEAKSAQGALDGITLASGMLSNTFTNNFRNKFNLEAEPWAGLTYDLVHLLHNLSKVPGFLEEPVSRIENASVEQGALGTYEVKGREIHVPIGLWTLKGLSFEQDDLR